MRMRDDAGDLSVSNCHPEKSCAKHTAYPQLSGRGETSPSFHMRNIYEYIQDNMAVLRAKTFEERRLRREPGSRRWGIFDKQKRTRRNTLGVIIDKDQNQHGGSTRGKQTVRCYTHPGASSCLCPPQPMSMPAECDCCSNAVLKTIEM